MILFDNESKIKWECEKLIESKKKNEAQFLKQINVEWWDWKKTTRVSLPNLQPDREIKITPCEAN